MQTPLLFTTAKTALASPQRQEQEQEYLFPFRSARAALSPATAAAVGPTHAHAFTLTIRGLVHHRETGALAAIQHAPSTAHLCLAREPNNEHDQNAIAVFLLVGKEGKLLKLGYVAKEEAAVLLGVLAAANAKIEREGRTGLRVLSLFDGIGAALVSMLKEQCPIALYCSSEIDPDALAVMDAHYPAFAPGISDNDEEKQQPPFLHVPLGDVRLIDAPLVELIQPDLLIGGSPCQDLSRLNTWGKGLQGDKSRLFFEYIRVMQACQTTDKGRQERLMVVLENVVPREEAQHEAMNRHMRLSAVRLNASEVSAASRDRLFWTNAPIYGLRPSAEEAAAELSDVLVSGRPAPPSPCRATSTATARRAASSGRPTATSI